MNCEAVGGATSYLNPRKAMSPYGRAWVRANNSLDSKRIMLAPDTRLVGATTTTNPRTALPRRAIEELKTMALMPARANPSTSPIDTVPRRATKSVNTNGRLPVGAKERTCKSS